MAVGVITGMCEYHGVLVLRVGHWGRRTNKEVLGFYTDSAKDILSQISPVKLIEMFFLCPWAAVCS